MSSQDRIAVVSKIALEKLRRLNLIRPNAKIIISEMLVNQIATDEKRFQNRKNAYSEESKKFKKKKKKVKNTQKFVK